MPSAALGAVLKELRASAIRVDNETITTEEFTQEYVDLESRLRNLRATETELRELLSVIRQRTQKATEILEVHERVMQIRGEIEQAQGRMQYLRSITSFSSLQVELLPSAAVKPVVKSGWAPMGVVVEATRRLTATLQWLAEVAIWIAIYVLPLMLLVTVGVWLLVRAVRFARAVRLA